MTYHLTYSIFGEQAILISWPQEIKSEIREDIYSFDKKIQHQLSDVIEETVVAYCSLTVFPRKGIKKKPLIQHLKSIYHSKQNIPKEDKKIWHIPVCYHPSLGQDIVSFAQAKSMEIAEVIKLHTHPFYDVCFLGFLPGFPYLSGLDARLKTPRLDQPRALVRKGSVAIGGQQTGVYPVDSPGGWHILGRTPISFFDLQQPIPVFLKAGDQIKFEAIELEAYHQLKIKANG